MASELYLDALPYIDQGYEESGVREAVSIIIKAWERKTKFLNNAHHNTCPLQAMQLVEEETRRYRPSKNYLEFLQPPKATFEVSVVSWWYRCLISDVKCKLVAIHWLWFTGILMSCTPCTRNKQERVMIDYAIHNVSIYCKKLADKMLEKLGKAIKFWRWIKWSFWLLSQIRV